MSRSLKALTAVLLALAAPIIHAQQPNILFIFSDDHRHDLLGKNNPLISTPNLDKLADSGVRFDRAYVTTAICSPSRAACLSGRYGSRNGVPTLSDPLTFPFATFPHDLAAAGYMTAQVGKWHLGTTPSAAGFQDYARINSNGSWFNRNIDTNIAGAPSSLGGTFYETVMADVVIDWIDNHTSTNPAQPFVMWWCNQVPHVDGGLKYPDVKTDPDNKVQHTPAGSPGGFRNTYNVADMIVPANWADDPSLWGPAGTKPGYLATSRFVTKSAAANYGGSGGYTNPNPGVRNATRGEDNVQQHQLEYYSAVTALDAEIGRVLDRLDDPNGDGDTSDSIRENTWVIFMGDNGWQTGHHKFTSKVLAYEESCRVPLIISAPGVTPRVETKFALNIDLTSMFYDLAGLAPPVHLQGENLKTLVENSAASWRSQFYYEAVTPENSLGAKPHDAIRTDQYKLIRTYATEADAKANTNIVFTELYDLTADPFEMVNQAENPTFATIKADLVTQLELEKAAIASSSDPATFGQNLAGDATVTASSQFNQDYPPENVIDGVISDASRWLSANTASDKWLTLELPETRQMGGAIVYSGWQTESAVADFRIEQRIEGSWEPILGAEVTGNSSQELLVRFIEGARTDALRFLFHDEGVVRVREIEVLAPEDVPEIEEHPDYVELNRSRYIVKRLNGGKPIITAEMFTELGATDREGGSINGATMIRLPDWLAPEDRADPSARYYLYFAHHGGHYIRMAWSETPTGPFTLYRVGSHIPVGTRGVLDMGEDILIEAAEHYRFKLHIASPEVLVDDENRRFVMYFHGVGDGGVAGQYSMPAVSADGLDFNDGLQPCAAGISYFRVFHVHGQAYAFANACKTFRAPEGARGTDNLAIRPPENHPIGFYWDWLKEFREEKIEGTWAEKLGITDPEGNIRHYSLLEVGENRFQLFYTVKEANPPERIFMTEFDATDPDWRNWTFSAAEEIMRPRLDWEGVNRPIEVSRAGGGSGHELRDPYIFRDDDGTLYLYYSGQGEDAIGVAQLIPRTYSHWQEEQDWPDGADQGMLEDSDFDGVCNLLEYALGLNVRLPDAEKLPDLKLIQAEDGPWWSFTFRRSHLPDDLDYIVRQSGNLQGWTAQTMRGASPLTQSRHNLSTCSIVRPLLPTVLYNLFLTMLRPFLFLCFILASLFSSAPAVSANSQRSVTNINPVWKFTLGDPQGAAELDFDAGDWETVSLPHTHRVFRADMAGFDEHGREIGWYRREIAITPEQLEGKVFLLFQGAMQATTLWVNGEPAGEYAISGYDTFHFDITPHLKPGKNLLAVRVDNTENDDIPPDGAPKDFVLFGGLYRDVELVFTGKLHVTFPLEAPQAGIRLTLPEVSAEVAVVKAETTVRNENPEAVKAKLLTQIVDRQGNVVAEMRSSQMVGAGEDATFTQTSEPIKDPHLWSPDDPYLYKTRTLVGIGDEATDSLETNLGIRWTRWDREEGFFLNGKPLKLVGANRHQTWPFIGNAVPNSLHRFDAEQMKAIGLNWVRLSHYPHDPDFLDALDELGLLALAEGPLGAKFRPNPG